MAQTDLGKVRLTDEELSEKITQVNGGVRFGKDADGKPGYVVTDAETGADTVIPFSSGGGGIGSIEVLTYVYSTSTSTPISTTVNITMQKGYKNILIFCLYRRGNKLKNFPGELSIGMGAANTYEMKEIYTQDNFSGNIFDYYKMLFCEGGGNGENINLTFSLTLKQADSASKNIAVLIAGIY